MFLTMGDIFPGGASEEDLARYYRPRPGLPFTVMRLGGEPRLVWTTFTSGQVDLDIKGVTDLVVPQCRDRSAHCVRRLGDKARCDRLRRQDGGDELLHDKRDFRVYQPYQGVLPPARSDNTARGPRALLSADRGCAPRRPGLRFCASTVGSLHDPFAGDPGPLDRWLEVRPRNTITVLDTHDGIGVIDAGANGLRPSERGLLNDEQVASLVESIHANAGEASLLAAVGAASNLDLYQVNSTFFDALGRDEHRYLLAHAVRCFVPGIPQVYYVGLLAGVSDVELFERTGVGRDINRHHCA